MAKSNKQSPPVTPMADILAMKQPDRLALFVSKDASRGVLCLELGKLFRAIEANLKGTQKIFPLLEKQGVKKGNIGNASAVAKVFDLVESGLITEAEFDRNIGISEALAIARVRNGKGKKQLSAEQVADHIKAGGDFADDLNSLAEHGATTAERDKAAADAAAAKAKQEKEAAEQATAEKAELEELRKRDADIKAAAAKAAKSGTDPAPAEEPAPPATDADDETVHDEPEPDKPTAKESAAPAAPVQITAKMVLDLLDEVELSMMELSPEDQAIVGTRLVEMADAFVSTGATVTPKGQKALAAK